MLGANDDATSCSVSVLARRGRAPHTRRAKRSDDAGTQIVDMFRPSTKLTTDLSGCSEGVPHRKETAHHQIYAGDG